MPSPMTIQARKITGEASRLGEREEARGQEDRSGREHLTAACPLDPAANEGETRPASTERQPADHRKSAVFHARAHLRAIGALADHSRDAIWRVCQHRLLAPHSPSQVRSAYPLYGGIQNYE